MTPVVSVEAANFPQGHAQATLFEKEEVQSLLILEDHSC